MAKNSKPTDESPEVVFPADEPQRDLSAELQPATALPVTLTQGVVEQLEAAIKRSGEALAAAEEQARVTREAHQQNLGMRLLMQQLAQQGVTLTQSPRLQ